MKKKSIIFSLFFVSLFGSNNIFSQANKKHSFSINFGPEFIGPEDRSFAKTHNIGIGLNIKTEYTFGKHASATFNTGYTYLKGKRNGNNIGATTSNYYQSISAIPLRLGSRYYLGNFYFLGELGALANFNSSDPTMGIVCAGIGDKIKIGGQKLDISLRQESWFSKRPTLNMLVLRFAYEFTW